MYRPTVPPKLGRMAHARPTVTSDDRGVSKRQLHLIAEDLGESAVEDWAAEGMRMLEAYLAKHADFLRFLESHEA